MRQITVVGASLAGLSAVRALREQGYDGRLTVVGAEQHLPYDRPPLSKAFLAGTAGRDELALLGEADDELDVDWQLGVAAVALRPSTRQVVLADGRALEGDGVVLATGARARRLPGVENLPGVHLLRTLDDAVALRAALCAAGSLVVVGAGFIGAEVASTARAMGLDVTVVEAGTPLAGPLGEAMGTACAGLHTDHGVRLLTGSGVARLLGQHRVTGVELTDGTILSADVVLLGVGAQPEVEWLAGSGLELDGGVLTDAACATSLPGVVAVGDCASSFDPVAGRHRRIEHWTHALQQPATAAATLLGASSAPYAALPYFWSEQYGRQLQFAGSREPGDVVTVVEGSTQERRFVATYERDGRLVAVLGLDAPGPFSRLRRTLRTQHAAMAS
ncbi:MAG: FAD-dependent oxidoreductase [Frankiales bacterium]|nr:FAD-dependent oxidoreductase [Frankiales bacterium]